MTRRRTPAGSKASSTAFIAAGSEPVRSLRVPTLILVGEGDEATPPPMARELATLMPDARITEFPGLAHVPQLQDAAAFVAALGGFLSPTP